MPRIIFPMLGGQLMQILNINAYELLQIMKSNKLIPSIGSFNTQVEAARLSGSEDLPWGYEQKLAAFQFTKQGFDTIKKCLDDCSIEIKQEYTNTTEIFPRESESNPKPDTLAGLPESDKPSSEYPVVSCPPGTTWKDVKITVISDDAVRIEILDKKEIQKFSYHQLVW